MAIKIKKTREAWRIEIDMEEWEFETRIQMENALKTLLDLKDKQGNIKNGGIK